MLGPQGSFRRKVNNKCRSMAGQAPPSHSQHYHSLPYMHADDGRKL